MRPDQPWKLKKRMTMGKAMIKSLDKLFTSKDMSLLIQRKLTHCVIFSVFTCSCEIWTLQKQESQQIPLFQMWCWRQILSIPVRPTKKKKHGWNQASNVTGRTNKEAMTRLFLICHQKTTVIRKGSDDWKNKRNNALRKTGNVLPWHIIYILYYNNNRKIYSAYIDQSSFKMFIYCVAMVWELTNDFYCQTD